MVNTGAQATVVARRAIGTRPPTGRCLQNVRTWYNAPANYASAYAAWQGSKYQHRTNNPLAIPADRPVWFGPHGSPWGHVAQSIGGGLCISTILLAYGDKTDHVIQMPIQKWIDYGYPLLGWTDDIAGFLIPGAAKPAPPTKKPIPFPIQSYFGIGGVVTGAWVKKIQAKVGTTVDGSFGPKTKAAVIRWQSGHNLVMDGKVGPKTWASFGFTQ